MSLSPHARAVVRIHAWQTPARLARYRYRLGFEINSAGRGRALFIGLNPSTASLTRRDPTVDVCCRGLALRAGFRELEMCNLFALRSTDKSALATAPDPVGPAHDAHLRAALRTADAVVLCWGRLFHPRVAERVAAVSRLLAQCAAPRFVIAWNDDGSPRHPLYQPLDRPLVLISAGAAPRRVTARARPPAASHASPVARPAGRGPSRPARTD
ncbi:MAG: DUF1643 domain-containing protein [Phycisphaerae bacterium]